MPAAERRSAVRVQHLEVDEENLHRAVALEGQHLKAVREAAAEAAQVVVLGHCFVVVRIVVEAAQVVLLEHWVPVARTVAEVAARHC